jgi:hypothetical protein
MTAANDNRLGERLAFGVADAVGNAVERSYRRGDALEKRRALMADWAAYCRPG